MLVQCAQCGYELKRTPETESLFQGQEDLNRFLLERAMDRGHGAHRMRRLIINCPRCHSADGWRTIDV